MDNEEMEELFGPLRAAGWNPRWMDRSVVHYDNSVAAGYPTDIGDVYSDDQPGVNACSAAFTFCAINDIF